MHRISRLAKVAALALAVFALPAFGGEVVFKNGDKLTGEVTELGGGKLKIKSAVAGEITVSLDDVQTFSSDKPIEMKLKDGTVLNQPVQKSDTPGTVATTQSASGVGASQVSLNQLSTINEPKPVTKWTGNLRAGGILTTGNSQTQALNAAGDLLRRGTDDRISANGQYLFGRQKNNDTGEKTRTTDDWTLQGKYDYFFTKRFYGYAVARFEKDNIAGLNLRAQPGIGIGYQWWERADSNFNTEAGIGYTYEDYEARDTNDFVNARFAYHYDRVLRTNIKFIHNLEYFPSLEDLGKFNLVGDAGIRVNLVEKMFADFKVEWKYDSEPSPGRLQNDLRYILSVGWEF